MELKNLSNGDTDGFALFYIKDKRLATVVLNKEQTEKLDIMLQAVFTGSTVRVIESDRESIEKYLK